MRYYHLRVKGTVLHKTVEGPYTGLKKGPWRRRREVLFHEKKVKGYKHSPAKTAPQLNLSSDVPRAALPFRENTGRLNRLAKASALCESLSVKHPRPVSALPLSALLPSSTDTSLYLCLLIPVLFYTDVLHSAGIFAEEEAAAALVRCKYYLAHPLPSPPKHVCMHTRTHTNMPAQSNTTTH